MYTNFSAGMPSPQGFGNIATSGAEQQSPYNIGSYALPPAPQASNTWQQFGQVSQPEAASVAGSDHSSHTSYIPSSRAFQTFNSFHSNTTLSQPPTPHPTAHHQAFPGISSHPYDISPEGSSQTDSTDHSYVPPHYQSVVQPGANYAMTAVVAPDQMTHLRSELAKKKQRIAELEHDVGATDTHRRQVQMHNFELEGQLAQMQQMLQGRPGGYQLAVDASQMHTLTTENAGLKTQLAQLSQQLYQGSGLNSEYQNAELQQNVLRLESTVSSLTSRLTQQGSAQHTAQHAQQAGQVIAQLEAQEAELEQEYREELSVVESQHQERLLEITTEHDNVVEQLKKQLAELITGETKLKQQHQEQLIMLEDDRDDTLLELKAEHATLVEQLTKQAGKLETDLKDAQTAKKAAADRHEAKVQLLTQQVEELQTNLSTVQTARQSIASEHEPVMKLLCNQKQQLEADLMEARSSYIALEDKLVTADLALVEAEEKLQEAEQKLKQAERKASKDAKTIRAQERQISGLVDEKANLNEQIQELTTSPETVTLTDENSRLKRESRLARDRFDRMQKEVRDVQQDKQAMQDELRDLQDRLTQFALQVPDDSIGDVLAQNSAGTAAGTTSRRKPLNTCQEAVIAELEEYQRANGTATGPVTLASVARERLQRVNLNAPTTGSAETSTAAEVVIPKVDFGKPKYFKPRGSEQRQRRSRDHDDFSRPGIVASPAVSLPLEDKSFPATEV